MEGEKGKGNSPGHTGRKANLTSDLVREYDFFVTPDGGESADATPVDRPERAKKKGGRNKSTTFFLSD